MRNIFRFHGRVGKHPALRTILVLIFISFLFRLVTLSFSEEFGQAGDNISSMIITKLCISVMESGSSLIGYHSKEVKSSSPVIKMLDNRFRMVSYTNNSKQALEVFLGKDNAAVSLLNKKSDREKGISDEEDVQPGMVSKKSFFYNIIKGMLSKEYILTNGEAFDESSFNRVMTRRSNNNTEGELEVGVVDSNLYFETEDKDIQGGAAVETMRAYNGTAFTLDQLKDVNFLVRNFYIVDSSTRVTDSLFDGEALTKKDMTIKQGNEAPQILIYHTHSQEAFADSREGVEDDTVVGIGTYLAEILKDKYGYNVIHDKSGYDIAGKVPDRNKAYNYARDGITKILDENPTIEVVIDLHRDGTPKRSTNINGKETAQIMLFNGLSRDVNGPITYLDNPNLQDNLAFSLQLQLKSLELYPGLFYRNYLKCYRYNMHVRPKCLLLELGTYKNTIAEAKNAMEPFAKILNSVLKGK